MTPRSKTQAGNDASPAAPRDYATRMAKALGHPLRTAIMAELNQRTASPVGLARDLHESICNVSYHVRVLLELDCVELVETRPRRGALEHFYRATARAELTDETWEQLPQATREAIANQWFRGAFTDVSQAMDAGHLCAGDVHMSFTHVELDEGGWAQINEELREVIDRGLRLHAQAAGGKTPTRRGRLVMAFFEAAPKRADEQRP